MKNNRKQSLANNQLLEMSAFIVEANRDLIKAEQEEDYYQCSLIQTALQLKLFNEATLLTMNTDQEHKTVYDILLDESNKVYQLLKAEI